MSGVDGNIVDGNIFQNYAVRGYYSLNRQALLCLFEILGKKRVG